jgi:hypothetical protein
MTTARGTWWLGGLGTALLVGSLCFAPASEANVYKWKDPSGIIHYTDKPPPADGLLISVEQTINSKRNEANSSQSSSPTPAASRSTSPSSMTPGEQARLRNAVQNDVASAQTDACKQAKERYQMYVQSRRLFKEGPNKERVYLSDQELEEARLNAKRESDEACGGQ